MPDWLGLLPHRPPMRLVAEVVAIEPGIRAVMSPSDRGRRLVLRRPFPGRAGRPGDRARRVAGADRRPGDRQRRRRAVEPPALRVAALGGFKFPGAATAGDVLEATARVVGRMGGLYKIEGEVTAGGRVVGVGSVTLAEARR